MDTDAKTDMLCESLAVLEKAQRYNNWLFSNIEPFLGEEILEVGCGIGTITQLVQCGRRVVAIEPYEALFQQAQKQFAGYRNIEFLPMGLEQYTTDQTRGDSFDSVICLNVLEHIEDDVAALNCMGRHLKKDGTVVVMVPALKKLYGPVDRSVGHWRRYGQGQLKERFQAAGLKVIHAQYMNMVGALGWFVHGRILGRDDINKRSVGIFERLVPVIRAVESVIKPPLGQSLIMVGQVDRVC